MLSFPTPLLGSAGGFGDAYESAFAVGELASMLISNVLRKANGIREIHGNLLRRVSVRAERDGYALKEGELKDLAAGINLPAILA